MIDNHENMVLINNFTRNDVDYMKQYKSALDFCHLSEYVSSHP